MSDQAANDTDIPVSPIDIQRDGNSTIQITWSDSHVSTWTAAELRKACPCATCREKKRADTEPVVEKPPVLPVISAAEARPLRIESMRPVGAYAYNIAFSDGHSSGIFPFKILHKTP